MLKSPNLTSSTPKDRIVRFALAAMLAVTAGIVRAAIGSPAGTAEYVAYYPAVILTALLGGTMGGCFSVVLCVLIENILFVGPHGADFLVRADNLTRLGIFLILNPGASLLIGRQKTYSARLRENERELNAMFENSVVGLALINPEVQTFMRVNGRICEIAGYSEAELRARTLSKLIHSGDTTFYLEYLENVQRAPTDIVPIEIRITRKDESFIWVSLGLSAICDEKDRPVYLTAVLEDIDARKQAEEVLATAGKRKDEFLAMLAHELRNPLSTISAAVALLQKPLSPDRMPKIMTALREQTKQLARLVDDLMDVSRITRGKIQLKKEIVDIRKAIEKAAEAVEDLVAQKKQHFTMALPDEPALANADEARVEQIVVNLLTNAIKYTEIEGSIHLCVRTTDGRAAIEVSDNGRGIPFEVQASIFEAFQQVDVAIDRTKGGLGIGLALVKRLAEMHGGSVSVQSDGYGQGSLFTVTLPLTKEKAFVKQETTPDGRPLPGMRMLVVEDNKDTADFMADLLRDSGHEVYVANDGAAGVSLAQEKVPDVVLLDIGLPGLNGYEVARRLRHGKCRHSLIIAVTGYSQDEDRAASVRAGFDYHLIKPLEYPLLAPILLEWQKGGKAAAVHGERLAESHRN